MKGQFGDVLPRLEYLKLDIWTDGQRQKALNHQKKNSRVSKMSWILLRNLSPISLTHSKEYIFHLAELCGSVLLECVLTGE